MTISKIVYQEIWIWEWLDINEDLLSPKDQNFIIMSCLGKKDMILGSKEWSEHIHQWFNDKENSVYWVNWTNTKKKLASKVDEQKKWRKNFERNQILSKTFKYALEDLFQTVFEWNWVSVFRSSEFDSISTWIDYIVVGNNTIFWIDLEITDRIYKKSIEWTKKRQWDVIPTEYNIYCWKNPSKYIEVNWKYKENKDLITIKRHVLKFNPKLTQLFLSEYMKLIKTNWYNKESTQSLIKLAWESATNRFKLIPIRDRGTNIPPTLFWNQQNTWTDLFETLIQW